MILIAGGSRDPNIDAMQNVLAFIGAKFVRLNTDTLPVHWDMDANVLMAGKYVLEFDAVYSRPNVFCAKDEMLAGSIWHDAITSYAIHNNKVCINAKHSFQRTAKMRNLLLAKRCGFDVPKTYVTAQADKVSPLEYVCKPVNGGAHTFVPKDLSSTLREGPSFVQEYLDDYDMRLYRIGGKTFAFYMESDSVDYRELQDAKVVYIEDASVYEKYIQPTVALADILKLDYCCVDLKKNKEDGTYSFLEINTLPMHAAFDVRCGMRISKAICELLHADN